MIKVILARGGARYGRRSLKRKMGKILKIGFLGALNGIRLRKWYKVRDAEDLFLVCRSRNVQIVETDQINSDTTRRLFAESKADLGLSIGNGYIGKGLFSIPKYGMINIHSELLPRFQGAQSVIWPIYEGGEQTGFTIHQMDTHIDTGDILFQKRYPIDFYPGLRETVEKNVEKARAQIPNALSHVCEHYVQLRDKAIKQQGGKSYTTPSFRQYLQMVRNHRKMYRHSNRNKAQAL